VHVPDYDFFISYKWAQYSGEAAQMRDTCRRRGYSAWIDKENPPSDRQTPDSTLAVHLRAAMKRCRYVIFFETFATLEMVIGGPPERASSWQEQELEMAEAQRLIVLYHGANPRTLTFGQNRKLHQYRQVDDAFDIIEKAIKSPSGYF
jgi:hypothetical protein